MEAALNASLAIEGASSFGQFTKLKAMQVTIALLSVVAVQLLRLRDLSRRPDVDTIAATEVIGADYVEVLSLWRLQEAKLDWNVKAFLYALARLGGHLGRRGDWPLVRSTRPAAMMPKIT